MKQALSILFLAILLISCSSNDDGDSSQQYLTPEFSKVVLSSIGQTACLGCSIRTYDFELSFLAENITVEDSGLTNGSGAILRTTLLSETGELPKAGIYSSLNDIQPSIRPFRLTNGEYQISALNVFDFDTPYYYMDDDKSQIEISYVGTQMIIEYDINLTLRDSGRFVENFNLKGNWDGDIQVIRNKLF